MANECSACFRFNFFITSVFSSKDKFVFFNKDSLYLSGKLSISYAGFVPLINSVFLYNLQDQLVVSLLQNVLFKSSVLTGSPMLCFG